MTTLFLILMFIAGFLLSSFFWLRAYRQVEAQRDFLMLAVRQASGQAMLNYVKQDVELTKRLHDFKAKRDSKRDN